ncbi:MAG: efflux RND transporter periplasmic adaptor subunit [Elusimicrobia bacterium]|nr:efflux RND transporter periplasmic adaptor subunit [Elusimicrobiota bacterium]
MRGTLCLAFWLAASGARAQQPLEVRRGEIQVRIRVGGTVVTDDIIRLRAAVDGRVEDLNVSTGSWFTGGKSMGHLANKEMAAILDSHNTTEQGVLEDRWKKVYEPTPIQCPADCYVLRVFIKNREWLKPKTLIVEAAQKLLLIGRVRPEDARWIKDGQDLEFWSVDNPSRKFTGRIARYVLDIQGNKVDPGGTFTLVLSPSRYFDPGTQWEGLIVPMVKKGVLIVPTDALIEYGGAAYLPVRVSTGLTTHELTEITAGAKEKQDILVLDDARLKEAMRHKMKPGEGAPAQLERQVQQDYLKPEPLPGPKIKNLPDPDANYGDDPYAQ